MTTNIFKMLRKFFDAAPAAGGGGDLPPSLSDIDGIQSGSGHEVGTNIAEPLKNSPEGNSSKADAPVEGVNPDGSLQDGYTKDDSGKVVKVVQKPANENKEAADQNEEGEQTSFWEDVDKLRGEPIQIDWEKQFDGEGNAIDPVSPQGAYIREKAVEKWAIEKFESYLKQTDPRGYAYMLHRQAGGADDDFFQQKTFSLPDYEAFKGNADVQLQVFKSSLISKGLDDESAQLLVEKAIKDNKVFDHADAAYKNIQKAHEKELAEIEEKNNAANIVYRKSVETLNARLTAAIQEGKGMNLIIPDSDKPGFLSFIQEHVNYDSSTGKFLLVQPVENESMMRQLESFYLLYKQGDLNALIKREAQSQNRKRLGKTVEKSRQQGPGGEQPESKGFVPLGSL